MSQQAVKRIAVLLFAAAAGAGCKDSPTTGGAPGPGNPQAGGEYAKLVGVWTGSEKPTMTVNGKTVEAKGDPIEFTFEFRADGTMTVSVPVFPAPVTGTWKGVKSEGNKVTIDTVLAMPSFQFESKAEGGKSSTKGEVNTKEDRKTFTITFETADRMVMAPVGKPDEALTVTRKK